jgi:hypothetical protein
MKSVGPEAVHPDIFGYMETAFRRAQQAGGESIVFGSLAGHATSRRILADEARRQFVELCSKMAPVAAR